MVLVTQQYDFAKKVPKAPTQSAKPVEVPQPAAEAVATGDQPEAKDKKEKKKKPAKEAGMQFQTNSLESNYIFS